MNNTHWELITKQLGGASSREENQDFERLMHSDVTFKEAFDEAQIIWNTAPLSSSKGVSKNTLHTGNQSIKEILSAIDNKVEKLERAEVKLTTPHYNIIDRRKWLFSGIAASIILLIGIFYTTETDSPANKIHTPITSYSNPKGEIAQSIDLPDGTKVLLLGGSQLELVQFDVGSHQRKVNLTGEAVFNVVSNPEKPFVVATTQTSVQVLGTVFSMQAYKGANREILTVREGKVNFTAGSENRLVQANQSVSYLGKEQKFTEVKNITLPENPDEYIVFDDIELATAKVILENHFNKKITIVDKKLSNRKIYGKLKKESLSEILQAISLALDIQYEVTEKEIFLKSR